MEKAFWLRRQQESLDMAQDASSAEARLVHLELAGRYSIEAAAGGGHSKGPEQGPAREPGVEGEPRR
ncbi:MAG TPA: hypothetical protein VGD10_09630 [Allosphingosinicella sp.]|uniref:hypothetical protein n=1 Tax=Allosphingosinicella sp. TaxID=2823234 RepID=UPI002ED956B0